MFEYWFKGSEEKSYIYELTGEKLRSCISAGFLTAVQLQKPRHHLGYVQAVCDSGILLGQQKRFVSCIHWIC